MTPHRLLCIACLLLFSASAHATPWQIADVGQYNFTDNNNIPSSSELSGLTWAGGNTYYAVGDNDAKLFTLNINLNSVTGAINTATVNASPLQLRDNAGVALSGPDREGVAFAGSSVYVANETGPEISEHSLTTGNRIGQVTTATSGLGVFANTRSNFGWESLTRQANGSTFWTANEEALSIDGPISSDASGTTVRLQKFDSGLNPIAQYAYNTDPHLGEIASLQRSGVSDLLALDNGDLLILERAFGLGGWRNNIYLAETDSATDVSTATFDTGLAGETYTPVDKGDALFSKTFSLLSGLNFEGITLGPTLGDGSRSLLLIADNGGGNSHALYALRLIPEPGTALLCTLGFVAMSRRRKCSC